MKIYREITLEWNKDTNRYDKVVSEDSYEYNGPLQLAQGGYWQYAQQSGSARDKSILSTSAPGAAAQETKKSKWGNWGGLIGAIGMPLLVASAFFSGGATMPLIYGMLAAGTGSYVGRKGFSALAGESKDIPETTYWADQRADIVGKIEEAQEGREKSEITGSLFDALSFGAKGYLGGTDMGLKAKDWYRQKVFGPEKAKEMALDAAGTSDPGVYSPTKGFKDIFSGMGDESLLDVLLKGDKPNVDWMKDIDIWKKTKDLGSSIHQYEKTGSVPWYEKLLNPDWGEEEGGR